MELWSGCVAGALDEQEFLALLRDVGFESPSIEPTRIYSAEDAAAPVDGTDVDPEIAKQLDGKFMSGFVRATKPGSTTKPVSRVLPTADSSARSCGCADDCCT